MTTLARSVRRIAPAIARKLLQQGYGLLDVRTPEEFAEGHLPAAVNVPLFLRGDSGPVLNPRFIDECRAHWHPEQPLIVACRSGHRSTAAAERLADVGFQALAEVEGGLVETKWGLAVGTDHGVSPARMEHAATAGARPLPRALTAANAGPPTPAAASASPVAHAAAASRRSREPSAAPPTQPEGFVSPGVLPLYSDRIRAALPADATVKGMLLQSVIETAMLGGSPAADWPAVVAFKDYPAAVYLDILERAATFLYPQAALPHAMQLLGRQSYPRFAATKVGRAVFLVALGSLRRILEAAPRAYALIMNTAEVSIASLSDGHAVFHARGVYTYATSYHVGVLEGAMEKCRVSGQVLVRVHTPWDVDFDISWIG